MSCCVGACRADVRRSACSLHVNSCICLNLHLWTDWERIVARVYNRLYRRLGFIDSLGVRFRTPSTCCESYAKASSLFSSLFSILPFVLQEASNVPSLRTPLLRTIKISSRDSVLNARCFGYRLNHSLSHAAIGGDVNGALFFGQTSCFHLKSIRKQANSDLLGYCVQLRSLLLASSMNNISLRGKRGFSMASDLAHAFAECCA